MKTLWSVLGWIWHALDLTRRALLNLALLLLLIGAAWLLLRPGPPALKDDTTLVLSLAGKLVEQSSGSWRQRVQAAAGGVSLPRQVRLRDVLDVLDAAAKDPKIGRVLLDVDDLGSAGLVSLHEVAQRLERVKAAGKQVYAWAESYSQAQYFLAAHASEVLLHPMGYLTIEGMGRHRIYYKDLFDRLGVQAHVLRAGRYKNFAEPYVANAPSAETLESETALYGALWSAYTAGIERARKLDPGAVAALIQRLPELMTEAGGDVARIALNTKLVDALKTEDELREQLIKGGAAIDEDSAKKGGAPQLRRVGFGEYLARLKPKTGGDAVAVVVAEGNIVNGDAAPGVVGGRSTAALIRAAREDEKVRAIVLRVRSPGGSAFASEQLRLELAAARKAGKPVVVSMGDVAASGGYWISQSADEVIADAATVTGSIGVIAMLPSFEGAMAKLGLKTGGITTTWLGDGYDPRRGLDPRFERMVQQGIDHAYADFLARVAAARKSTPQQIDAVAQGRVWTGAQAHERGLVDRLGSFDDALKSARQRAKLPDDARVVYFERGAGRLESWLGRLVSATGAEDWFAEAAGVGAAVEAAGIGAEWRALAALLEAARAGGAAPQRPLVHCGCEVGF